jgi:hypothetical protein
VRSRRRPPPAASIKLREGDSLGSLADRDQIRPEVHPKARNCSVLLPDEWARERGVAPKK